MIFNSPEFLAFFPLTTLIYFLLPHRYRWSWLLTISCFFYMVYRPIYILVLLFTIVVDYWAGIAIEASSGRRRLLLLWLSIASNCGVLAVFKYFNFLNENITGLASLAGVHIRIPLWRYALPIGLSFHTFQAMSYTIEVYRSKQPAERHFGIYALYVMFYPQLVAGPIERPQNLLHQFRERHEFDYDRVTLGLKQMAWGFFKKVVIADRAARLVNTIFAQTDTYPGPALAVAAVAFAFQIYCDFSGYSDIAIGAGRVLGFTMMKNFDSPYLAQSVTEFWRRWHISLSTWFRDYVYVPLGGNRVSRERRHLNVFTVFLISGLWHGSNWTFVAWGAMHGCFVILESILGKYHKLLGWLGPLQVPIRRLWTFGLVSLAWIYFRANSMETAKTIVTRIPFGWENLFSAEGDWLQKLGLTGLRYTSVDWIVILVAPCVMLLYEANNRGDWLSGRAWFIRWPAYYLLVLSIIVWGDYHAQPFIYFQF